MGGQKYFKGSSTWGDKNTFKVQVHGGTKNTLKVQDCDVENLDEPSKDINVSKREEPG